MLSLPSGPLRLDRVVALCHETLDGSRLATTYRRALEAAGDTPAVCRSYTRLRFLEGHPDWRRWAGLSALAAFCAGEHHTSARYAILGGEWPLLRRMTRTGSVSEMTWLLIGGTPEPCLPDVPDDYTQAWLELARSIPARDHSRTEEALAWLADDACDLALIGFDAAICAAAGLARHTGLVPLALTERQRSRLAAGLVGEPPAPLFPHRMFANLAADPDNLTRWSFRSDSVRAATPPSTIRR